MYTIGVVFPEEYTVQKFLQLAGYPRQKNRGKLIEGGCPMCKEGKSWGRKRRLYLMVRDGHIYCHNCGWSGDVVKFIQEVEHKTYSEILHEASDYDVLPREVELPKEDVTVKVESLPHDSINIYDTGQLEYYLDNGNVMGTRNMAKTRRLLNAINKPKTLSR